MKISVIYPFFPHYRAAILRELTQSRKYEFEFWGDTTSFYGIKSYVGDDKVLIHKLSTKVYNRFIRIKGYKKAITDPSVNCVMIHGAPNWPDTWLMALIAKIYQKPVIFWSHGWLRHETWLRTKLRKTYFNLGNATLVYGDRAKVLAKQVGFNDQTIYPIYNSLNVSESNRIFRKLQDLGRHAVRSKIGVSADTILLSAVARLNAKADFACLLKTGKALKENGFDVMIALIGDGPERRNLETLSKKLEVSTIFLGEIYDEEVIGPWLFASDAVVSPGKVGLTAMHAMAYGTPVFTHGDFDAQMPEAEAIEPGISGDFFRRGSETDLTRSLKGWFRASKDRSATREHCRRIIEERYNPISQRMLIEQALDDVFSGLAK